MADYRPITISAIVEGHGEINALPELVQMLVKNAGYQGSVIVEPLRIRRDRFLNNRDDAKHSLILASTKLRGKRGVLLIFLDAEDDCPVKLLNDLSALCEEVIGHIPAHFCFPKRMYENWFVASAKTISKYHLFTDELVPPNEPEACPGKGWIKKHTLPEKTYSPTVDQKALTKLLDVNAAAACRSFQKLQSVIGRIIKEVGAS